jgi:antitoxin VapB
MNLQIRNPRAYELAKRLARRRGVSITDAVIAALEADLTVVPEQRPVTQRVAEIAAELRAMAKPGGRDLNKAEIDAMWGQP